MKIGEYEQMMAYLTRPGFKDGTEEITAPSKSMQVDTTTKGIPLDGPLMPEPKPYTSEQFKLKADLYIKGALGGFDKGEMINLLQEQLDKVQASGTMEKEEAIKFIQERTKLLKDFIKENPGETLPSLETREEFSEGTKKYDYKDPQQKNQYVMRTNKEIQKIIDDPKYKDYTRKDFRNENILTRKETERKGLEFKNFGKKVKVDKRATQNVKQSAFIKGAQGSGISMDKVNNFAHFAPKLKSYLVSTANTGPIKANVNRAAEGYDKAIRNIAEKQEKLVTEKPKGYVKLLETENAKAAKLSKDANKILPSGLKGTLGYFQVDKEGNFKLKGVDKAKTFAGLSGDEKVFKTDMTPSQRKDFGKTQSTIQTLIDKVPSLKRASSLKGSSGKGGSGTQAFDMLKPDALSPLRKTKYLSEGGSVKYGKYAKQITKLS